MKPVAALFMTTLVVKKNPELFYDADKQLNSNWKKIAEDTGTWRKDTEDRDA